MISNGAKVKPDDGYDDCGFSGFGCGLNGEKLSKFSRALLIFDSAGFSIGMTFGIEFAGKGSGRGTETWPKLPNMIPSLFANPESMSG